MWRRSYRNHVIMAFPSFDTATNSWAPQADISWCAGADRFSAFVRFHDRAMSEAEAVDMALRRSVHWINEHLKQTQTPGPGDPHRRKPLPAFEGSFNGTRVGSRWRRRWPRPHKPAPAFSYGRFKALMARLGIESNEASLHKSYEALLKLCAEQHRSWIEVKKKVERSREITTEKTSSQATKKPALPLTPRDWQRIV